MKKFSLILALILVISLLSACGEAANTVETTVADETTEAETTAVVLSDEPVRVFTLQGPTGMGMAKMITDTKDGNSDLNYEFNVASAPTDITPEIISGKFEIAAVPTNLAATLYNKTEGNVKVAAVNTLGVLYVLEAGETIKSVEDLEGKTIYSSGEGSVPEYALNYILDAFEINCEVIYEAEHDQVVSDLVTKTASVAILPEPKVTAALLNENAPDGLRVALDLTELWKEACEKKGDDSELCMGCVVVNSTWLETHENEFNQFMEDYAASVEFINTDETAPALIEAAGIIPKAPIAKKALPNCHIVFVQGDEMKGDLSGFLNMLNTYNPAAIGGKLPADDFYVNAK